MQNEKLCKENSESPSSGDIELKLINMSDVNATQTSWLWFPYIPYGKITIIQGDPGEGKTTLVLNLAAALTRGESVDSDEKHEPITVIYQTAEDGLSDTVKPRLIAANADCSKVIVIDETEKGLSMTDDRLEAAIRETQAKFIILDPLQAYLGSEIDMHRANEIRPVMSHLGDIADKYGCSIVLIGHMNKSAGMKASYRGLGSIDIVAAARSVLVVARDKDNPTIRVVIQTKNSLAPEGKPVAFELDEKNHFKFLGEYDIDPDDLLMGIGSKTKVRQAIEMLQAELQNGKKPQKVLLAKANYSGISKRTLDEAKKALSIQSVKESDGWYWYIPEAQNKECKKE